MNNKLRLLVTTKCHNKCLKCCNKGWDFNSLPVVDRWNYEQIMITGGEPLLFPLATQAIIQSIRNIHLLQGTTTKIYIYTSIADKKSFYPVLDKVDGIVYTPHSKKDVESFLEINKVLLTDPSITEGKSMRLNLFADIKAFIPENTDLSKWQVKDMEWVDNCPVPDGEDFRRISSLITE